ncbi:MAG: ATP-binding cassette domain-containing protein, partial [Bacteroidota bacterium]
MSFIEIKNIEKEYNSGKEKVFAVKDISLNIEQNEFVSIMGHSGSGKSTLL